MKSKSKPPSPSSLFCHHWLFFVLLLFALCCTPPRRPACLPCRPATTNKHKSSNKPHSHFTTTTLTSSCSLPGHSNTGGEPGGRGNIRGVMGFYPQPARSRVRRLVGADKPGVVVVEKTMRKTKTKNANNNASPRLTVTRDPRERLIERQLISSLSLNQRQSKRTPLNTQAIVLPHLLPDLLLLLGFGPQPGQIALASLRSHLPYGHVFSCTSTSKAAPRNPQRKPQVTWNHMGSKLGL